jgi:hypothetical protein
MKRSAEANRGAEQEGPAAQVPRQSEFIHSRRVRFASPPHPRGADSRSAEHAAWANTLPSSLCKSENPPPPSRISFCKANAPVDFLLSAASRFTNQSDRPSDVCSRQAGSFCKPPTDAMPARRRVRFVDRRSRRFRFIRRGFVLRNRSAPHSDVVATGGFVL